MQRFEEIRDKIKAHKSRADLDKNRTADDIAAAILCILSNEEYFLPYLNELNKKLADKVNTNQPMQKPNRYETLHGANLPHPPSSPLACGDELINSLEEILLENEQKNGVNINRTTKTITTVFGAVPEEIADEIICKNELWTDDNHDLTGFIHGPYSHRLQYYIVTRSLEDHLKFFPIDNQKAIFKKLVFAKTKFKFVIGTYDRTHWQIALDNDLSNPSTNFLGEEAKLTAPAGVMEYLMNPDSFVNRPQLANCIYHAMNIPIFRAANSLKISSEEVFNRYKDAIKNKKLKDKELIAVLNDYFRPIMNTKKWVIINLETPVAMTSPSKSGLFANGVALTKEKILKKYAIPFSKDEKSDLERALRCAAASGHPVELQTLLNKFGVNCKATAANGKSALHYAVIKSNENNPKDLNDYTECVELLLKNGADPEQLDADKLRAADYDKNNYFKIAAPLNITHKS